MYLDLKDQIFGRLTVIEKSTKKHPHGATLWVCHCSCGTEKIASTSNLRDGSIKSCGCLYRESRHIRKYAKSEGVASFNRIYNDYTNRAKKLGIIFELTEDQFRNITSSNCYYCGIEPKQFRKNQRNKKYNGYYLYNGIDRVDNGKGYTLDNVVPCCGICNKAKRDLTIKEFNEWIQRLVQFQIMQKLG